MAAKTWKTVYEGEKGKGGKNADPEHAHEWGAETTYRGLPARFCKDGECRAMQTGRIVSTFPSSETRGR